MAPANTHWLVCDYPGCDNWFHESCPGVKFASDFERENYAFLCKVQFSKVKIEQPKSGANAAPINL